jgi:hypothetical protein
MGLFGYSFIDLSEAQKHARRELLDLNAAAAQVSIGIVLALIQICYLAIWVNSRFGKGDEEGRPSSPYAKHEEEVKRGFMKARVKNAWKTLLWWMGDEVGGGMGRKGDWVLGGLWLGWLLCLCIIGTGEGEFFCYHFHIHFLSMNPYSMFVFKVYYPSYPISSLLSPRGLIIETTPAFILDLCCYHFSAYHTAFTYSKVIISANRNQIICTSPNVSA